MVGDTKLTTCYVLSQIENMDPRRTGQISELAVEKRIVELGYRVSRPVAEYPYDLVVEIDGSFERVQVKTARDRTDRNVIRVDFQKMSGATSREYYDGTHVDAFAAYYDPTETVYWFWFDDCPRTGVARAEDKMKENEIAEQLAPLV